MRTRPFIASRSALHGPKLLQIHHQDPWARGGGDTVDNLAVLCASHNRLLAEQDFGTDLIAERIQAQRERTGRQRRTGED